MYEQARSISTSETLFAKAGKVPKRQLEQCSIVVDRDALLQVIPKGGIAAVYGRTGGEFVLQLLELTAPAQLHVASFQFGDNDDMRRLSEAVAARRLIFHDCPGLEVEPGKLDWAYIGSETTLEAVNAHIESARPALRKDGLVVFSGFPSLAGVVRAVNDFAIKRGGEFVCFSATSNDVVLRVTDGV